MAELCLGIARARHGPAAALIDPTKGMAACEENRLTRARQAPTSGPPDLAIQELLAYLGETEDAVRAVAVVKDEDQAEWWHRRQQVSGLRYQVPGTRYRGPDTKDTEETQDTGDTEARTRKARVVPIEAHEAHAEYAFRASGWENALVLVCDPARHTARASGKLLESVGDFPISRIYSALTAALGLQAARDEHLVEAMARAGDAARSSIGELIRISPDGIAVGDSFQQEIAAACSGPNPQAVRCNIAASVQRKLGACLEELLRRLSAKTDARRLCLSGGLFFNTHFTTTAATSGAFDETYLPPHPGRGGSALGAALVASRATGAPGSVRFSGAPGGVGSPYLGPGYSDAQVKEALENCKLSFDLQREEQVIDTVLRALSRGRLVGWFHGRLEWGPRALGHRTVLADPLSPHVLDNLNGYLKKRPAYRSYGVSVPLAKLHELFEGPPASPFMQYEYRPRDPEKFRAILPAGVKTLRVHTVDDSEPRYLRLLERWGEMSGTPVLVNTSFNGFHEPLVCSPRDAIRVFYGTGLDLLALEDFVLRK